MLTVVLESYVVDVAEGNTDEDTRLFADTVVKLNLQRLAAVTEGMARESHVPPKWSQNMNLIIYPPRYFHIFIIAGKPKSSSRVVLGKEVSDSEGNLYMNDVSISCTFTLLQTPIAPEAWRADLLIYNLT
ncbi:hypothetical protein AgCh_016864 [Apium graveolens]